MPRRTPKRQDRKLAAIVKTMRKSTSKQMNIEWGKTSRVNVSDRTLRNRLIDIGSLKKSESQATPKHQRLQWTTDDWKCVIFSDESQICVGNGDEVGTFVWRQPSEKFEPDCLVTKS